MSRTLSSLLLTVSLFVAVPAIADNAPVKSTSVVVKAQPVAPIKAAPPVAVVNSPAPASSPTASPAVASAVTPNTMKSGVPKNISHKLGTEEIKVKVTDTKNKEVKGKTEIISANRITFTPDSDATNAMVLVEGKVEAGPNVFLFIAKTTGYSLFILFLI